MYKLSLLLLVVGCAPQADAQDLRPFIAVAGRYALMAQKSSPQPVPGEKCKGCRGLGVVGDGRTSVTCSRCDGTGVEPKSSASAAATAPLCKDGKCTTPLIVR